MAAPTKEEKERTIAALIEERKRYKIHGETDRLKAVDAELKALAATAEKPSSRAQKRPATKKASKR